MKQRVITKGFIVAVGLLLCHSVVAGDLHYKITQTTCELVEDVYLNFEGTKKQNLEELQDPKVFTEIFISTLANEYSRSPEIKAYRILLPKLFEIVRTEAIKRPWFWKSDYKKSDWWKALNEKDGKANRFMAYLYNINGVNAEKIWTDLKMSITPRKTMLFYSLNENIFHQEPISLFKRHWGKFALAGVLAAGAAGYAGYQYRGQIAPVVESARDYVHTKGGALYQKVRDLPGQVREKYRKWRSDRQDRLDKEKAFEQIMKEKAENVRKDIEKGFKAYEEIRKEVRETIKREREALNKKK